MKRETRAVSSANDQKDDGEKSTESHGDVEG
jgi:hypothetical protein